mgnify:CR=1 FL=1|jgi:tRNA(Ile)-lysidine synthase
MTYIVAVSGGVDSVVLLDVLSKKQNSQLIVAHVDHGIRTNSNDDAVFVKELASHYGLPFEMIELQLGQKTSENTARMKRYKFLQKLAQKYHAQVATAHHKNDVVETMVLNIFRGTGWRGICSLQNGNIYRPLLAMAKQDIITYAQKHSLTWREDETNNDQIYLRNYIRHTIMSHIEIDTWWSIYQNQLQLRRDIDHELEQCTSRQRYDFIMYPKSVALELLKSRYGLTRPQAKRALIAIKTSKSHARIQLSKTHLLRLGKRDFSVEM